MRKNQEYLLLSIIIFIGMIVSMVSMELFFMEVNAAAENSDTPKKNFELIPFIWTVGIVGGCIAVTLSYVSWRKYKGEEKKKARKDKTID